MTGAGISVSAGIPDFRTPGTGLYDNLKEYDLPYPEAIFTLHYFKEKPEPFFKFMKHFDLKNYEATPTHYFIKFLADKKVLWKNLTQNIDNLEEKTGIEMDKYVVQAHGANRGAYCPGCSKKHDKEELQQCFREDRIMRCSRCEGPVKPDIVFFGEQLPRSFHDAYDESKKCDLLIVLGTALAVGPFNSVVDQIPSTVPKVLINMHNTKEHGYDFVDKPNRLFLEGKCDESILKLVKDCKWQDEFREVLPECHKAKL